MNDMRKTVLSLVELGAIEVMINVIENAIDRDDLIDLVSDDDAEIIMEYYSQGIFDDLKKVVKS
jgi:hypothetical protein